MAQKNNKRGILAKIETTYGVDATPTGAANAIQVFNLDVQPLEGSAIERQFIRPFYGSGGAVRVENYGSMTFEVELAGAGAAGTAPKWGPLLQAAGFAETISTGVDVAYDPVSSGEKSLSIYYYLDGRRSIFLGARCSACSLVLSAKQIPSLRFTFLGLIGTFSDTALPTFDTTGFQVPATVSTANTTGLSLHGFAAAKYESLTIDLGPKAVYRQLVGGESVEMTGRAVTGQISMEATLLATFDPFTKAKNASTGAFAVQHGQVAGNIISVTAPKMQFDTVTEADSDGIAMWNLGMKFQTSAATGNDEIKITVK
jgi:hypothetical protein